MHLVGEDDVASVDDAWNVSQDGEQNADGEMVVTALLQKNSDWWEKNGADELWNVGAGKSHVETEIGSFWKLD